jgi:phage gp36-like protein
MARFLKDSDYFKIRAEIKKILDNEDPIKLKVAEDTAIAMIRSYIGGRYDCDLIFVPFSVQPDERNKFIIDITISITLYKLYQQLGSKDIPAHRQNEYDDAVEWLKDAGRGNIPVSDLPSLAITDENPVGITISSRPPTNHKY